MTNIDIDESNIEKLVPNYHSLSDEEKIFIKEKIYRTQLLCQDRDRTLEEIIEKQIKAKKSKK